MPLYSGFRTKLEEDSYDKIVYTTLNLLQLKILKLESNGILIITLRKI